MIVLSVDPGTAHLAMTFIQWKGGDWTCDNTYTIPWMSHIDLSTTKDRSTSVTTSPDKKYESMTKQLDTLHEILDTNKNLKEISKRDNLWVVFEQQEGARDINVLFSLMRVNLIVGVLCRFFHEANASTRVRFLPKTYKCGWSFISSLAKEKTRLDLIADASKITKRRRNEKVLCKTNRKKVMCTFVRCLLKESASSNDIIRFAEKSSDTTFNHIADSTSQGIRFIKEMQSYHLNGKIGKDTVSSTMQTHVKRHFFKINTFLNKHLFIQHLLLVGGSLLLGNDLRFLSILTSFVFFASFSMHSSSSLLSLRLPYGQLVNDGSFLNS